jgi:hypothetical protein
MKPIIIPEHISDAEKQIRKSLHDSNELGVVVMNKRRYGNTLLQRLVSNTEDIDHSEIKQLLNSDHDVQRSVATKV